MERINRYTVENDNDMLFAYSNEQFALGENVKVTFNSRSDGVLSFMGMITSAISVETRGGKLKELYGDKYNLDIGTICIERR
jgi:hypothetical protein